MPGFGCCVCGNNRVGVSKSEESAVSSVSSGIVRFDLCTRIQISCNRFFGCRGKKHSDRRLDNKSKSQSSYYDPELPIIIEEQEENAANKRDFQADNNNPRIVNGKPTTENGPATTKSNEDVVRDVHLDGADTDDDDDDEEEANEGNKDKTVIVIEEGSRDGVESPNKEFEDDEEELDNITTVYDQFAPEFSTLSLEAKSAIFLEKRASTDSVELLLKKSKITSNVNRTPSYIPACLENENEEKLMLLELNTYRELTSRASLNLENENETNFNQNAKVREAEGNSSEKSKPPKKSPFSMASRLWEPGVDEKERFPNKSTYLESRALLDRHTAGLFGALDRNISTASEELESYEPYVSSVINCMQKTPSGSTDVKRKPEKQRRRFRSSLQIDSNRNSSISATKKAGYYPGVMNDLTEEKEDDGQDEEESNKAKDSTKDVETMARQKTAGLDQTSPEEAEKVPEENNSHRVTCRDVKTEWNTVANRESALNGKTCATRDTPNCALSLSSSKLPQRGYTSHYWNEEMPTTVGEQRRPKGKNGHPDKFNRSENVLQTLEEVSMGVSIGQNSCSNVYWKDEVDGAGYAACSGAIPRSTRKRSTTVVMGNEAQRTRRKCKDKVTDFQRPPSVAMLNIPSDFEPDMDRAVSRLSSRMSESHADRSSASPLDYSAYDIDAPPELEAETTQLFNNLSLHDDTGSMEFTRGSYVYPYSVSNRYSYSRNYDMSGLSRSQHGPQLSDDSSKDARNLMFFKQISQMPNFYEKQSESEKEHYIPEDPNNYISQEAAAANMEFFRTIARTPAFFSVTRKSELESSLPPRPPKFKAFVASRVMTTNHQGRDQRSPKKKKNKQL